MNSETVYKSLQVVVFLKLQDMDIFPEREGEIGWTRSVVRSGRSADSERFETYPGEKSEEALVPRFIGWLALGII